MAEGWVAVAAVPAGLLEEAATAAPEVAEAMAVSRLEGVATVARAAG